MPYINKVTLPSGSKYDIEGTLNTVVGTQTSTTASWVGTTTLAALKNGVTIGYYLPVGSAANVTLNLTLADGTTTGAKNCYFDGARLGTQFPAKSVIVMTYLDAATAGNEGWYVNTYQGTNYTGTAPITVSGTTISHDNSGATAGSYGDSAAQTPSYGDTFKVPYVTVDAKGHVTSISDHTVKIPSSDNTDTKVTQTKITATTSAEYDILLSGNAAGSGTTTTTANKDADFKYNTGTNTLTVGKINSPELTGTPKAPTAAAGTDSTQIATTAFVKTAVDTAVSNLPDPMVFKGTLGSAASGATITELPTASDSNEGQTYKVITAGTYASQAAKVGDVFCCATLDDGTTYQWILIPAGDDIEDTWRNIKVNGTQLLSTAISSGAVNFKNGTNVSISGSGNDITISATNTDRYVNTAAFADDTTNTPASPVKMTLTRAGSDTATVTANIPKVSSSTAGVAPKGAAVSSQSQSTKFLREDGSWAVPSYTTNTNTWRPVQVNDTDYLTDSTTKLDLVAGTNATLTTAAVASGVGKVTVSTPDVSVSTSGSGNAVTAITQNGHGISVTKGSTFLTSHQTIKQDGVIGATASRYATCSIAAGTAAKTATITSGTFTLEAGARIIVKFANANTASSPTLNVYNSSTATGAKNIFYNGAQITSGANKALLRGTCEFIYDGTQYHLVGPGANVTSGGLASGWSAGSTPTLGTAIPADDITAWTTNTPTAVTLPTYTVTNETLTISSGSVTAGSAASLSYTAKSIPNVTSVGSAPTLTVTTKNVFTTD